jgi:hypothetical protein
MRRVLGIDGCLRFRSEENAPIYAPTWWSMPSRRWAPFRHGTSLLIVSSSQQCRLIETPLLIIQQECHDRSACFVVDRQTALDTWCYHPRPCLALFVCCRISQLARINSFRFRRSNYSLTSRRKCLMAMALMSHGCVKGVFLHIL